MATLPVVVHESASPCRPEGLVSLSITDSDTYSVEREAERILIAEATDGSSSAGLKALAFFSTIFPCADFRGRA